MLLPVGEIKMNIILVKVKVKAFHTRYRALGPELIPAGIAMLSRCCLRFLVIAIILAYLFLNEMQHISAKSVKRVREIRGSNPTVVCLSQ